MRRLVNPGLHFSVVMAGLDPAIQVFPCDGVAEDVDARHKAGHDTVAA
jgi:hypothetical protein